MSAEDVWGTVAARERGALPEQIKLAQAKRLLQRVLNVADSGNWRDGADLSLQAHPLIDDLRSFLSD